MENPSVIVARKKMQERRSRIEEALQVKYMTVPQIAMALNMSESTAYKDIEVMRAEGIVYVFDYEGPDDARATPVFAPGCEEDAPMPEKKRLLMERRERAIAKRQETAVVRQEHVFRYWMDVALFGEYRKVTA